jgi:5-methylcytosine-specific restriction protein B
MNLDIKKRIDAISHPEGIKLFFEFINHFIKDNSISENDERFVLNVRNDYRKRFSVNINSRLVLYIKGGNEFGFMINQDDWHHFETIPYLTKDAVENNDPLSFIIAFSSDEVFKHKDLIEKFWLKSCKDYLPQQQKSQYRKHHIQELFNMASDRELLNKYLSDTAVPYSQFSQIVNDFAAYIKSEDSKLNDFELHKIHPTYVWISDGSGIIGKDGFCHYELITRKKYPEKIWIELHFDERLKKEMKKNLSHLLDGDFFWNTEHGEELSLALKHTVDYNDAALCSKLENGILHIQERFGPIVRDFYLNEEHNKEIKREMQNIPLNQILYGPPGTGKTYNTINKAISIADPEFDLSQSREKVKERYDQLLESGQVVFTTFHQSMSYEDFIEGIKPHKTEENEVYYDVEKGLFRSICEKASEKRIKSNNFTVVYSKLLQEIDSAPESKLVLETLSQAKEFTIYKNSKGNIRFHANTEKAYEGVIKKEILEHYLRTGEALDWSSYTKSISKYLIDKYSYSQAEEAVRKRYVLIIDEINRGNVSQIFGELITLIEESKRLGNAEELKVTLPYSKKEFGVPANLYIIGTMNTADRSVEALDSALRRRFSFVEMMPDLEVLNGKEINGISLKELLSTVNKRVEILLGRDHTIGHSYFIDVKMEQDIRNTFKDSIIPLLQEYFYGDYEKIGMILGNEFFDVTEKYDKNLFANFATQNYPDPGSLIRLRPIDKNFDISKALNVLLKKEKSTNE